MSKSSKKSKEKLIPYSKQELIEKWLELFPTATNPKTIEENALAGYVLTPLGYVKASKPIESQLVTR